MKKKEINVTGFGDISGFKQEELLHLRYLLNEALENQTHPKKVETVKPRSISQLMVKKKTEQCVCEYCKSLYEKENYKPLIHVEHTYEPFEYNPETNKYEQACIDCGRIQSLFIEEYAEMTQEHYSKTGR